MPPTEGHSPGAQQPAQPGKIRVIVVDDSAFMRQLLKEEIFKNHPEIEVIDAASDGVTAVQLIKHLRPDVVTLDVEMPTMGGIETLEAINRECPTPVIMLSSFTRQGAEITVKALELGAIDFVQKPSVGTRGIDINHMKAELTRKITMAANLQRRQTRPLLRIPRSQPPSGARDVSMLQRTKARAVVIGSSTGGPKALQMVLPLLPADFPLPVLVVQHMPPSFTTSLALRLNQSSQIKVKEAVHGDIIEKGTVYIAPGDYHMEIDSYNAIRLNQEPPHCGVRPSVDKTLVSAAEHYAGRVLGVILTGMGHDGEEGIASLKALGGRCIAEHESTCVVYGMPKAVVDRNLADAVVPLQRISTEILHQLMNW